MNRKLFISVLLSILFVGLGCASQPLWRSEPNLQQVSNEYYAATISPIYIFNGYKGFLLYVHNKSPDEIDIDWENTFYIYNGKKEGGFLFEGMRSGDKIKTPSIISGSMFSKEIFPAKIAEFSKIAMSTIYNPMNPGENGVYLSVKVKGKEVAETLTINITQKSPK